MSRCGQRETPAGTAPQEGHGKSVTRDERGEGLLRSTVAVPLGTARPSGLVLSGMQVVIPTAASFAEGPDKSWSIAALQPLWCLAPRGQLQRGCHSS